MSDNKDHELLLEDLRDALALIVRTFQVIARNLGNFHAESEVMIKAIDLIAVIQRVEGRIPAKINDGLSAEDFLKAFSRDLRGCSGTDRKDIDRDLREYRRSKCPKRSHEQGH